MDVALYDSSHSVGSLSGSGISERMQMIQDMLPYPTMHSMDPNYFERSVPPLILPEVNELFEVFNSVVKYDKEKKTAERLNIDHDNYMKTVKILQKFQKEGRFKDDNEFTLNKTYWKSAAELAEWKKHNIKVWYEPVHGKIQKEYAEGLVGFVPGDIVTRKGAGAAPFEHWGIYIGELDGEGYTLEIVRDQEDGAQADIRLTPMSQFVVNQNYPMFLSSTISSDGNGGFIDRRKFDREVSLWTGLKNITVPWVYGLGYDPNEHGVYDQTCQSYVNILIMGEAYTTQIWENIFNMTNTAMTIYMGQLITRKMLERHPNVCVEPCKDYVFAGRGSLAKDCVCISSCGTSIPLVGKLSGGKSWCYVDQECGKKNNREKYKGYYYDYCDNKNTKFACQSGKEGKFILCSNV